MRVERTLEWLLSWKQNGDRYERSEHFTDIEKLKRARTAVMELRKAGLAGSVQTRQRYIAIPATEWDRPGWIR